MKTVRFVTALTGAAFFVACVPAVQAAPRSLSVEWPQDHSDIRPDPAARFGRLANGMTYMIYRNATPAGTATIHFRFAGGSMVEDDDQRGLAHFVEHMAFEGSTNIPNGQLIPLLQRHGFTFGADVNAFTTANKTEYMLDLPKTDDETVDTALMIMRETAGNLTFPAEAVEHQRDVVLGEERLRQSPQLDAAKAYITQAYAGQTYATRALPIGLPQIVRNAPRQRLIDYYHADYRPELATLVIVGDIDPDKVEAQIKARFSNWQAAGLAKTVDGGAYKPKGLQTFVLAEKGLPDSIQLTWFKPFDAAFKTNRTEEELTEDGVLRAILNRRLLHLTQQPGSTFASGQIGSQTTEDTAESVGLNILPRPGQDKAAFEEAVTAYKALVTFGITQAELDPILADMQASLQNRVKDRTTVRNGAILDNFIGNLDARDVFTSPEQDLAFFNEIKPRLTVERLNARLKVMFGGDGPLLVHTAEDTKTLDADALKAAYAEVMAKPAVAYSEAARKDWPYTDFGAPQAPVSHTAVPELGFTQYVFANGVKLNVKTTPFKADEIRVSVRFGGGLLEIAPDSKAPVFATTLATSGSGLFNGGLGKLTAEEIRVSLAGKSYAATYTLTQDSVHLSGNTTKADLATELQVLMAYTTDAGFRPEAFDRVKAALPNIYTAIKTNPGAILSTQGGGLLRPGDVRFAFPSLDEVEGVSNEQVKRFVQGQLKDTPVEITMVGAISDEEAVKAVGSTFAALARRPASIAPAPGADHVSFPTTGLDQTLYHQGRADQSISAIFYPVPDFLTDTQTSRGLEVLAAVLRTRLFEQVREKQGQAYEPSAGLSQSDDIKGLSTLNVTASVKAGGDASFREALSAIIADLKANPVSADELTRAVKPMLERLDNNQKENQYWMNIIPNIVGDRRRFAAELNEKDQLSKVTPDQVEALAVKYLDDARALHIHVVPEPAPPAK